MKKSALIISVVFLITFAFSSCAGNKEYVLNEKTFFLVMTNMLYYPEQYENKNIELDCFTYDLTDVDGVSYRLGVRKCSAGYGCKCGKDTVIGFILVCSEEIPAPKNQSEDTIEKTWIHLIGKIASAEKKKIKIYAYDQSGAIDKTKTETIEFLTFNVQKITLITDYSGLSYYVTK